MVVHTKDYLALKLLSIWIMREWWNIKSQVKYLYWLVLLTMSCIQFTWCRSPHSGKSIWPSLDSNNGQVGSGGEVDAWVCVIIIEPHVCICSLSEHYVCSRKDLSHSRWSRPLSARLLLPPVKVLNEHFSKESTITFAFFKQNWSASTRKLSEWVKKQTVAQIAPIIDDTHKKLHWSWGQSIRQPHDLCTMVTESNQYDNTYKSYCAAIYLLIFIICICILGCQPHYLSLLHPICAQ